MYAKYLIHFKYFFILISYFNSIVEGDIPYGLCANPTCSVPVSKGITILKYSSPDDNRLSFKPKEKVDIFVKEYGPKKDLWGVIVRGHKGYISKLFIREEKAMAKQLVPAIVDFKSPVVTSSNTVASNIHESSHHHKPIHMHTAQQDINPTPTGMQLPSEKPNDNLQASHFSPQFNPSQNMYLDLNSKFNVPDHSSQFAFDSKDILSSHVPDVKSVANLLSQSHVSNIKSTSSQDKQIHTTFPQNSLNNGPNIPSKNPFQLPPTESFDPGSAVSNQGSQIFGHQQSNVPSQYFQPSPSMQQKDFPPPSSMHNKIFNPPPSISQQNFQPPPNMHHQNFQPSPNMQQHLEQPSSIQQLQSTSMEQMDSSFISDYDYDISDNEYSETLALLGSKAWDLNNIMHKLNLDDSSQNIELNSKQAEFYTTDSYTQQPPGVHPPSLSSVDQEKHIQNTKIPERNKDYIKPSDQVRDSNDDDTTVEYDTDDDAFLNESETESDEDNDAEINEDNEDEYTTMENLKYVQNIKINETVLNSSMTSFLLNQDLSKNQFTQRSNLESSHTSDVFFEEKHILSKEKTVVPSEEPHFTTDDNTKESKSVVETNVPDLKIHTSVLGNSDGINLNLTSTSDNPSEVIDPTVIELNQLYTEVRNENKVEKDKFLERERFSNVPDRNNNGALQGEGGSFTKNVAEINELFTENEQKSDPNKFVNTVDVEEFKNTYQVRNLKGETVTTEEQQSDSDGGQDENTTQSEPDIYSSIENTWDALKSFIDSIMAWIPEPLYSIIMGLQEKGISPRVPVFTVICGFTIIFLIVPLIYIKEYSKEAKLSAQLASLEKDAYTFSATNAVLEEKLATAQSEVKSLQTCLEKENAVFEKLKSELNKQTEEFENTKTVFENYLEENDTLKEKEFEYLSLLNKYEKERDDLIEQKKSFENIIKDNSESIANLTDQLLESERNIEDLQKEKMQYEKLKEDFEEKLSQFEMNCNQLLKEAEAWNFRVNELNDKFSEERTLKEEIESSLKGKEEEIESLKQLVETFESFKEIEDPEEQEKTKEEKLQTLMNSSLILTQLKKKEDETKVLADFLEREKKNLLDMEVELIEAKSEIDKLKINYNQALQDRTEAQTKLDVLTNYFKDKEIQLQKQLGAQEAVRQKKEDDVSSAERRIVLIEQENASYKYQVASMKQEMEETERNLKSQIAVQEKKAHENWIAARAAERKLEDMKQEVTQLRQRLTLLEREQENWANASRDEIIRPVPKRMPGINDESGSQDMNTSERNIFPPPILPPPPMMLPPDRPLPPLPHMFMPPMERHFRPQPWHLPPPDPNSDFRSTPPEFIGRESTPPRRRHFEISDGDGPHASSPLTTDTRDSRNSTPPHLLPDFHDVPPQSGRLPFYPPPPRLPMHPPFRRDMGPGPKRLDNPNEYNSRGPQQAPSSQEQWQHSRV